jgi:hypothetical protein
MYRDNHVDQYYDPTLLAGYDKRYVLFTGVIVCLALAAILIPAIIRLT